MKPIERGEVLGLSDYEAIRDPFRTRVIQEKKRRRVLVGPNVSAVFENRDTVLFQIQEMLRTERITKEAGVQHEIDTYNELIPPSASLSATLMIEIQDAQERESLLDRARGFERHIALRVDGERVAARWDEKRVLPDRASAVLYVQFPLPVGASHAIREGRARVEFVVDHPVYEASASLGKDMLLSLAGDLEP